MEVGEGIWGSHFSWENWKTPLRGFVGGGVRSEGSHLG